MAARWGANGHESDDGSGRNSRASPAVSGSNERAADEEEHAAVSMAVAVRVTEAQAKATAAAYADDGIDYDEENGCIVCAACMRQLEPWQVDGHVALPEHAAAFEEGEGLISDGLSVTINGIPMLLDCSLVFPRVMFGAGRQLYDDTLGCLLAPDITGAVDLRPGHEYTVVEFRVPNTVAARPPHTRKPVRYMNYFAAGAEPAVTTATRRTALGCGDAVPRDATAASLLAQYWVRREKKQQARCYSASGRHHQQLHAAAGKAAALAARSHASGTRRERRARGQGLAPAGGVK